MKTKTLIESMSEISEIDYQGKDVKERQREGALAINDLLNRYDYEGESVSQGLVALVLVRLKDLQVRDYAMGIVSPANIDLMYELWQWLSRTSPVGYLAPVSTLHAEIAYEKGELDVAYYALDRALADEPSYGLAKLLRRTFAAGWPAASFVTMRAELHPKICAALFEVAVQV